MDVVCDSVGDGSGKWPGREFDNDLYGSFESLEQNNLNKGMGREFDSVEQPNLAKGLVREFDKVEKKQGKEVNNEPNKTRKRRKLPGWMLQNEKNEEIDIGCGKWHVTESECGPGEWSGVGERPCREVGRGTNNEDNGCGNWSNRDSGCGTTTDSFVSECGKWPGLEFDSDRLQGGTVPENLKNVRDDLTGEYMRETINHRDKSDANIKKRLFVGTSVGLQGGTVPDILDVEDKCVVQKYYKVNINTLVVRRNVEDVETCGLLGGAVPTEMDLERGTVPTRNFKCTTLRQPTLREFRFEKKEECKKEKENVGKTTPLTRKLVKDVAFKKKEEVIGRNSQIRKEKLKLRRSGMKRSKWQDTIEKPFLKRGRGARVLENSSEKSKKSKIQKVSLMVDYFERLHNSKGEQRGLKNQKQENFYQQPRDGIEVSSRTFLTNFKASGRKNCDPPIGGGEDDNIRRRGPIREGGQTGPTDGTRGEAIGISSKK